MTAGIKTQLTAWCCGGLLLAGLAGAPVTHANDRLGEAEAAVLATLAAELERLQTLVWEAERHASADSRFPFNYQALRRDLHEVEDGIREALDAPSRTPRTVTPLQGEY